MADTTTAARAGRRPWRRGACALILVGTCATLSCSAALAGEGGVDVADPSNASNASTFPAAPVCVDAEVDGVRVLSYDCLTRRLMPSPSSPSADRAQSAGEPTPSEQLATMPSNRVGTFNLSAERNRFGANFGNSVVPQRPAPLLPVMPRLPAIPTH